MNLGPYRDESPPSRQRLANGAVLLTVPVPAAQALALGVWVRLGTQDEPPGLGGLSHFLEHIVFKGSVSRSAYDLAQAFDAVGAAVDAFSTKDHVAFTVKVLPEYFETAAGLLADMLLRPALDPEMIALEQEVVCEEIQEASDTPEDRLHDAFAARVYGAHPRSRPILGSRESVLGFDAGVLRREHARVFAGPNLVVALAGALPRGAPDRLASLFGEAPPGEAPPSAVAGAGSAPSETAAAAAAATAAAAAAAGKPAAAGLAPAPSPPPPAGGRLELKSPIVQTYFEFGNLACSYRDADRIPLFVLANILGGGMSSRVFQAVREREGLAYTVYTYNDMGRDTGLVSCAGSCSPGKAARLEKVVREEYARLLREGVAEDELANNRAQIKSQLIFSLEGVTNQMSRAAKNEIFYGRFVPVAELVDQIDGLDRRALARCAAAYFDPARLVIATHGPA